MKQLSVLHWLAVAVLAASLPVTARAMSGHRMGGFAGGGPRGFMGGGPRGFMGGGPHGFMGGGPHGFMGGGPHGFMRGGPHGFVGGVPRGFAGFGFRQDDRFFADHFAGHNQFFPHNRSLT